MRTLLLTALLLLATFPAGAQTVYRVVQPDGTIHFSDQPGAEGEEVEVKPLQVIPSRQPRRMPPPATQTSAEEPAFSGYRLATITAPEPETTFFRNSGEPIRFVAQLVPELQVEQGHRIAFYLNGERIALGTESSHTLDDLYRGAYRVRAAVVNEQGRVLIQSEPVPFQVFQPSLRFNR